MIREILSQVVPGAKVTESKGEVEFRLPEGLVARFRIESDPDQVASGTEPSVLWLDHADPRTLTALRGSGISFVTSHGQVFLRAPGLYVDVRPSRSISDPDRMRNPFSPRGRQVCVTLLLDPGRHWTVSDLAAASSASQSFVSRVATGLKDQGLVEVDEGGLRPLPELLFAALAEDWPKPTGFYMGRVPRVGEAVISGGPVYERLGLTVPAIPRIYVANRDQLRLLVVQTHAAPSTSRMADWEVVFQPLPLKNALVPPVIVALELARDPRGREVLRSKPIVPWPIHG